MTRTLVCRLHFSHIFKASFEFRLRLLQLREGICEMIQFLETFISDRAEKSEIYQHPRPPIVSELLRAERCQGRLR